MKKRILQLTCLAISIIFIVVGVMNEEHLAVFRKAVSICLECIGIG